ncbi:hypothetical protein [Zooshikella ganghwensis]|uniref:hypothetical protein n=1 Tax=Zooshikella ganghwensis TaxID=202772 RepID=UPI0013FD6EBA|nr:hypothetical protein [Zooshikella ganghwensis]
MSKAREFYRNNYLALKQAFLGTLILLMSRIIQKVFYIFSLDFLRRFSQLIKQFNVD